MEDFIPQKEAKKLQEIGFKEQCFGQWRYDNTFSFGFDTSLNQIPTPLYQQAFRWFRTKHNLDSSVYRAFTKATVYCWGVSNRRIGFEYPPGAIGARGPSFEEAQLACLQKLIEIVEKS